MTKDEIWEELKKDETKIYGQSLFDVFVQTTDDLTPKHFMELDKELRNKISGGSVCSILLQSSNKTEMADVLGQDNISKLTGGDVYRLLDRVLKKKDMASILGKEKIGKLSDNYVYELLKHPGPSVYSYSISASQFAHREDMVEVISQYKENLTDDNIYNLLLFASNKKEIAKTIGQEKIDNLSLGNSGYIYNLIYSADETGSAQDMADILGKEIMANLSSEAVKKLIQGARDPKKMVEVLGKENMSKLTGKDVHELMGSSYDIKSMVQILGQEAIKKLAKERMGNLSSEAVKKLIKAATDPKKNE